ncbi:hypothetical protein [Halorubrum tibetense]|uniref:Uncharacterized protein n=1 Tax=Halorubrum tibetense TaxID=175631 RepID=A0ABD5SBV0_9EURY
MVSEAADRADEATGRRGDATDRPDDAGDATDRPDDAGDGGDAGSPLVDRWIALDRGWQALVLGLGIVGVHPVVELLGRMERLGIPTV